MKYFTSNLWQELNSTNDDTYYDVSLKWNDNALKYQEYFSTINHHFSPRFLKIQKDASFFHDYVIENISIDKSNDGEYMCNLTVSNEDHQLCFIMSEITSMSIDITSFQNCILGRLSWGYHEFELTSMGSMKLAILCDIENEFVFEFKQLSLSIKCSHSTECFSCLI